jgi:hypothetical protein
MSSPQSAPSIFPPSLDQTTGNEQLPEQFGWLPAYMGVLSLAGAIGMFASVHPLKSDLAGWGIAAGLALFAAWMLWYEFRRRSRRTVLVSRSGSIGIYRKGEFVQAMTPRQLTYYKLDFFNTIRMVIVPTIAGLIFLLGPLFWGKPTDKSTLWGFPLAGVVILLGCASGVRTRLMLDHWHIPKKKGHEEILLKKGEGQRLQNS